MLKILIGKINGNGVVAQGRTLGQFKLSVESTSRTKRNHLIQHDFVSRIQNGDMHLAQVGQPEVDVILGANDTLESYRLAGPINRPVGIDVHVVFRQIVGEFKAEFVGADAPRPIFGDGAETLRLAGGEHDGQNRGAVGAFA